MESFLPPADRWSQLLADDRAAARAAGTAVEPVPPVIPVGIELPVTIHFTGPAQLLGQLFDFGDSMLIGEVEAIALADRHGRISVLELLDNPTEQRRRWGSYKIRRGPWPEGIPEIRPGSARWETNRSDYYRFARGLPFETERDAALEEARKRFGSEHGPCSAAIARTSYGHENPQ